MAAITYIEHNGKEHKVEVDTGMNLMEGATLNLVPGVIGLCGGVCSCATCHCYVPKEWQERVASAQPGELSMLEAIPQRRSNSRLGCQVQVTEALDGLVVHLPDTQGDTV